MANVPRDIYVRVPTAPCKGCEDRAMQCHSSCIRYKEWKEKTSQIKREIREAMHQERMLEDYEVKARRRMQTRRRRRD